jgi:endonuclease YncB( thermonuclease family)
VIRFFRGLSLILLAAGIGAGACAGEWAQPSGKWETLTGCRYVPSGADDGDSFYVRAGTKTFLFRLYSVDTAETSMNHPERVAAQARHFGITSRQTVRAGVAAEEFTARLLSGASLTVETCWQDAKGNGAVPRYYAVVTVNGKDLAEQLVAAGLARVYGFTPEGLPGFSLERLKGLERGARTRKLGAYGFAKSGATVAATRDPSGSRLPPTLSAFATPASVPALAASGGKVDLNTATLAELEAVPGIGPHYAQEIIAGRPYRSVEEIVRVKGIGPKTRAKFARYLSVGGK